MIDITSYYWRGEERVPVKLSQACGGGGSVGITVNERCCGSLIKYSTGWAAFTNKQTNFTYYDLDCFCGNIDPEYLSGTLVVNPF